MSAEKIRYIARLSSFASGARDYSHHINGEPLVTRIVAPAVMVEGLAALDLSYPDDVENGNAMAIRGASLMGVRDPLRSAARRHHPWHDGKRPHDECTSVLPASCGRIYHYTCDAERSCNATMR